MHLLTRGAASRAAKWLAAAVAAAAVTFIVYYLWVGAEIVAGFPAKMMCSCLFVERRDVDACRADVALQGLGWVVLVPDWEGKTVEARALRLRTARAEYNEGAGCSLR